MKSLIRIAGLIVIAALTVGAVAAFADAQPQQQRYTMRIADLPRQDSTPEATAEATEAVNVREAVSEAVSNRTTEAESSSATSTLFSIIVAAIVGAVVLAAAAAGAIYVGVKLVQRKGD